MQFDVNTVYLIVYSPVDGVRKKSLLMPKHLHLLAVYI